jgi:exodeoxyribonuclease-1
MTQASFLFHDYETFGTDPRRDRPAEFACWRTDTQFQPIAEPVLVRCQPPPDYLPDPGACALTGIGPMAALAEGLPEPEFARRIHAEMAEPGTCSLGYNSIRFDDEFTRNLFWRNFLDPYEREWRQGNSRFDLIDLARAAYALRPEGLSWPLRDDGQPSFRLEDLAAANALPHSHAHSALSDVEATIALARRLWAAQPKLCVHALGLRDKHKVAAQVEWRTRRPFVHVSQRFPAARGCLAVMVPLALHPTQANKTICVDAGVDPTPVLEWPVDRLATELFRSGDDPARVPLGIKLVHANRAPFVAPLGVLKGVDHQRIQFDEALVDKHVQALAGADGLAVKLASLYRQLESQERPPADPEEALYDGFVGDADRKLAESLRRASPEALAEIAAAFRDHRLATLAFRYRARHHPGTLDRHEQERWRIECSQRLREWASRRGDLDALLAARPALSPELAADLRHWWARAGLGGARND